jgi:CMP-N,N'-diacetyllegionaminic acid synthase
MGIYLQFMPKRTANRIVAVIPARGGSKGIPRKNIINLNGKPLIQYSIQAGLDSQRVDECYVSTDDEEIEKISKNCGAQIIKRPSSLAGDTTSTFDVIKHSVEVLDNPDIIVILQPTSPLRTHIDIDNGLSLLKPEVQAVIGVCEFHGFLWKDSNGNIQPEFPNRKRRQILDKRYIENGALYITKIDVYRNNDSRIGMGIPSTGNVVPFLMHRKTSIETDSLEDFEVIQHYMERELNSLT